MVALPEVTPVIKPVDVPAVAIAVLLLLQEPPVVESVSVMADPVHTFDGPVITGTYSVAPTFTGTVAVCEKEPIVVVAVKLVEDKGNA